MSKNITSLSFSIGPVFITIEVPDEPKKTKSNKRRSKASQRA